MKRKKLNFVQSLARGLGVLQCFTAERPFLTLTEIANLTGMNTTAVQRFTDTLLQLGFLHRNRQREFILGPKALTLGFAVLRGSQLRKTAEIYIAEFSEKHRCTMNLALLDGDEVVFLYRHEAQRFLKYDLHAGSRLPSYCTATGKVLLAALPDKALEPLLARMKMEPLTRYTITRADDLRQELVRTRKRGYSVSDRELSIALYSIGVPVLNQERRVVAAMNLSISADETAAKRSTSLEELKLLGFKLSNAMGYEGEYPLIESGGD
jgi:IclR family pca regulon transcriptional regulator